MGRLDDTTLPPRVKAAFEYLHLARIITEQVDAAIPMRSLSTLEKSVEGAALRTLQQYLLGEMDFAEPSAGQVVAPKSDEGNAPESVNSTR